MTSLSLGKLHSYTRGLLNITVATEQICANSTYDHFNATPFLIFICVCKVAMIPVALCGNLIVIISVSHFKQLHTPTNVIICSLAVVDLLVGALVLPGQLVEVNSSLKKDTMFCYFLLTCTYCLSGLSMYSVSLISLDQLYALWKPLLYATRVSVKAMSKLILITWMISLAYNIGFVHLIIIGSVDVVCIGSCRMAQTGIWSTMDVFITFFIPCSIIMLSYLKIFAIARRHARNIADLKQTTIASTAKSKKHISAKAAFRLGKLVALFAVCVVPPFLILAFSQRIPDALLQHAYEGASLLHFLHCAINPLLYALLYPWFQKCAKLIIMLKILNPDSALIAIK